MHVQNYVCTDITDHACNHSLIKPTASSIVLRAQKSKPAHRVLIVAGNGDQHAEIKDLLEVLDTRNIGTQNVVRTFALTDARADNVVNVLAGVLNLDAGGTTSALFQARLNARSACSASAKRRCPRNASRSPSNAQPLAGKTLRSRL